VASLLLIDDSTNALGELFSQPPLDTERWTVERIRWSTFDFEAYNRHPAEIIVATALPTQERVFEFFDWLRTHPTGSVTIFAIPPDVDAQFLQRCFDTADDFTLFPIRPEELRYRIARILRPDRGDAASVRERLSAEHSLSHLVGSHPAFVREVARIPTAARSECEVLITGETGTGKELCARAIHQLSRRSGLPFVCADCAALPDQLFENEMFGHERGAFTDAHRAQKGLVAVAGEGTLFLDEIDSLSPTSQAKLLRLLQDRTYKPLGAERFSRANVRIVAATNKDLQGLVDAGAFRRDLFFRINVLRIHMMPLRERADDVPALAEHLLALCCTEMRCARKTLAPSSSQLLRSMEWPGNVRELYNTIRRAVVFCDGRQILPAHLQPDREGPPDALDSVKFRPAKAMAMRSFERRYVEDMLRRHQGNITRAALEAGKDRRVFGRMVKRLEIDRSALRASLPGPGAGRFRPTGSS
jgi:two-component system response regulator GlrR